MITITLDDRDAQYSDAVRRAAARLMLYDVNYSDQHIAVRRGDFTEVDDDDEVRGASLLATVHTTLQRERGELD